MATAYPECTAMLAFIELVALTVTRDALPLARSVRESKRQPFPSAFSASKSPPESFLNAGVRRAAS